VLFQAKGSGYTLNFTDEMSGKVAVRRRMEKVQRPSPEEGGAQMQIVALDSLRMGGTRRRGGGHQFPLTSRNRGKIVIDDITVLFQFVEAPPESARMLAKQDFRPRLMDDDDPVFLGFLALFASVAAVMLIWAINQEPLPPTTLAEIPDRFVDLVIPQNDAPDPEPIEAVIEQDTPEAQEAPPEEVPAEAEAVEPQPSQDRTPQERAAEEARRIQDRKDEVTQKSALLGLITTRGERNNGTMARDIFAEGDATFSNLENALRDVGSAEIASTNNGAGVRGETVTGGRGDATVGGIENSGGGGRAEVASAPATAVRAAAISTSGVDVAGAEGADAIRSVLRSKSGQVKYCYEQRLKENPNLSGRIAVDVSITGGRVASAIIAENTTGDTELESCVTRKIRSWRFPADAEGDVYLPFALSSS